ncbi:MAG: hypothetical protein RJB10_755, partial [Pseudomonadota bacterium]
ETQKPDGSYESKKIVNQHDILQSTAYATLAMLYLKESGVNVPKALIDKSIAFLYSQKQEEKKQVFWKGGVYFSGGTVVRNMLYFTSDAYTTALVSMAFCKASALVTKKLLGDVAAFICSTAKVMRALVFSSASTASAIVCNVLAFSK